MANAGAHKHCAGLPGKAWQVKSERVVAGAPHNVNPAGKVSSRAEFRSGQFLEMKLDQKTVVISTNTVSLCTGGQRYRDMTSVRCLVGQQLFGQIGRAVSHTLDSGGPLDAPEVLPAGSVSNMEWVTGSGRPVVAQTETRRGC